MKAENPAREGDSQPGTDMTNETDTSLPTMSVDDAKHLTDEIKSALDDVWDLVARAYRENASQVLGYDSWDTYIEAEFGTHRIRVPREEQWLVVMSLRDSGLTVRDMESATGISKSTVLRHLSQMGHRAKPTPDTTATRIVSSLDKIRTRLENLYQRAESEALAESQRAAITAAITRIAKTANLPLSDPTLAWTAPRIEGP
jgi:hypothetical protein